MLQEKSQTISLVGKLFFVTITAGNEHVSFNYYTKQYLGIIANMLFCYTETN